MTTVAGLLKEVDELWPPSLAEAWDTPGLQAGNRANTVSRILLAVDVTPAVIAEAVARECDAIVAHHPLLLRGVTTVDEASDRGFLVSELARTGLSVIAAHTNADVVDHGVSDVIARALELNEVEPIESSADATLGLGRVGALSEPRSLADLVEQLSALFPATVNGIRVVGPRDASVSRIALCAGAGDSLLTHPLVASADVYITSDLRHHPALDAKIRAELGNGPWLVDVSHWASESIWLEHARQELSGKLQSLDFVVSDLNTDPWDWRVE